MANKALLRAALLFLLIGGCLASCSRTVPAEVELKYDNNSVKDYLPVSAPSFTGYLVAFTAPSENFSIRQVRINGYVAAWGTYQDKAVEVSIWDGNKQVIYQDSLSATAFPVNPSDNATFNSKDSWTVLQVPGVAVSGQFYVHVYCDSGRWGEFRMGADDSVINTHSFLTVRDSGGDSILDSWPYWKKDASGNDLWYGDQSRVNWMVRVDGTP